MPVFANAQTIMILPKFKTELAFFSTYFEFFVFLNDYFLRFSGQLPSAFSRKMFVEIL